MTLHSTVYTIPSNIRILCDVHLDVSNHPADFGTCIVLRAFTHPSSGRPFVELFSPVKEVYITTEARNISLHKTSTFNVYADYISLTGFDNLVQAVQMFKLADAIGIMSFKLVDPHLSLIEEVHGVHSTSLVIKLLSLIESYNEEIANLPEYPDTTKKTREEKSEEEYKKQGNEEAVSDETLQAIRKSPLGQFLGL